jgi:hypothetical protein
LQRREAFVIATGVVTISVTAEAIADLEETLPDGREAAPEPRCALA